MIPWPGCKATQSTPPKGPVAWIALYPQTDQTWWIAVDVGHGLWNNVDLVKNEVVNIVKVGAVNSILGV